MENLQQLLNLPESELHEYSRSVNNELESYQYQVGLALLACDQRKLYLKYDCTCAVHYAVVHLDMLRQRASEHLRVMRALADLPRLHEAYRTGRLRWSKIREVTRVATSETDEQWLDYALEHTTDQVASAVVMSPREYHRTRIALGPMAQLDVKQVPPEALPEPELFEPPAVALAAGDPAERSLSASVSPVPADVPRTDSVPSGRKIKLVFELTPEEYAHYERAEDRVRQQAGRRISRNQVLVKLTEAQLQASTSESRSKAPVVVRIDGATGRGWYETRMGLLAAAPEQVQKALAQAREVLVDGRLHRPRALRRRKVPRRLMRALMARAGGKCEKPGCENGPPFDVHHKKPVSRGGQHSLEEIELYCKACHALSHQEDFRAGNPWQKARDRRRGSRSRSSPAAR